MSLPVQKQSRGKGKATQGKGNTREATVRPNYCNKAWVLSL